MSASRVFDPRDDERIVALYARMHADDASIDALGLDAWRAFRSISRFEGGSAFRVAEDPNGAIVALLTVGKMDDPRARGAVWRTRAFVDPAFRRRGIASMLVREVEDSARAANVRALEAFLNGPWAVGRAFAESRGFVLHVHDLFLTRPKTAWNANVPAGVTLRAYENARDAEIVARLANATLSRDRGFVPETATSIASYTHQPGFASWIAETSVPVGFCHTDVRGRVGYVQAIGVDASAEGRGIGAALLSRAIETLAARDVDRIELCTEKDNLRAQRLYARAGFVFDRDGFTMRKALTGTQPTS